MSEPAVDAADEVPAERRTSPLELLWDLVFVFAVTQVTTLLARGHPTWARVGESMLVLALVWWAWSAFVWAANAQATSSRALRVCLLVATAFIFAVGLKLLVRGDVELVAHPVGSLRSGGCKSSPGCVLRPQCSPTTPSVLRPCQARFSLASRSTNLQNAPL
ncbi:MAG: low temperature requirement protein A [Solirubrobacteraceae bacterium]